jgi:hypothetical protein
MILVTADYLARVITYSDVKSTSPSSNPPSPALAPSPPNSKTEKVC